MKHYFKNLLIALLGNDPYRMELERVKKEYGQTAAKVKQLEDTFLTVEEKKEEAEAMLDEYKKWVEKADTELTEKNNELAKKLSDISSLQTIVENYRVRIREKDEQIRMMDEDFKGRVESYKKRIEGYSGQIARLQAQLDKAKKRNKPTGTGKKHTKQETKES